MKRYTHVIFLVLSMAIISVLLMVGLRFFFLKMIEVGDYCPITQSYLSQLSNRSNLHRTTCFQMNMTPIFPEITPSDCTDFCYKRTKILLIYNECTDKENVVFCIDEKKEIREFIIP